MLLWEAARLANTDDVEITPDAGRFSHLPVSRTALFRVMRSHAAPWQAGRDLAPLRDRGSQTGVPEHGTSDAAATDMSITNT